MSAARIDFTKWTFAQLAIASRFADSPHYADVMAELARRAAA